MRTKNKLKIYKRSIRKDKVKVLPVLKSVLSFILLGFSFVFVYVWLNIAVVRKGYLLSTLEAKREHLEKKNKTLKLEVTKLKSLDRLEKIARGEIGLTDPKENEVIWINR